ncbi:hypothetical protein TspCOW1_08650 [Thiohalobacter sp. COW1]|uniref:Biotin synthase n=1 Tax=Thiohalobacter thiocyanaticus TaxID=585455 RepID=A0A1Z4VSJ6_9GAMM|nr:MULTISPECIES: hypothetical protein [Thiohalobacter]BAZ94174.1 biotin synthase [Thiohalobacter thiocyanaticus]BCO30762.1 hypothetical protein TspCOW1_08650 [Thiohalobacter sp. COW1]
MKPLQLIALFSLMTCTVVAGCTHTRQAQLLSVYKYDGSVQCEDGGITVENMRRELVNAGVEVICGQKARDGRAYPAMCGAATGRINVYTIDATDLDAAEAQGFKSVETLPDARIPPCE